MSRSFAFLFPTVVTKGQWSIARAYAAACAWIYVWVHLDKPDCPKTGFLPWIFFCTSRRRAVWCSFAAVSPWNWVWSCIRLWKSADEQPVHSTFAKPFFSLPIPFFPPRNLTKPLLVAYHVGRHDRIILASAVRPSSLGASEDPPDMWRDCVRMRSSFASDKVLWKQRFAAFVVTTLTTSCRHTTWLED